MKTHAVSLLHIPKLFDKSDHLPTLESENSPSFEAALISSFRTVAPRAESEQPSKRKLSQSRELLALTLKRSIILLCKIEMDIYAH